MKTLTLSLLLTAMLPAGECRVLIDGMGCHTRQLAVQRIFERLPGVDGVAILPRSAAPADNQRIFVIRSEGEPPTLEKLVAVLGRRTKYYRIVSVTPAAGKSVSR